MRSSPYVSNFREIADAMVESGGCRIVRDSNSLSDTIQELAADENLRSRMGRSARGVLEGKKGASAANAREILSALDKNL